MVEERCINCGDPNAEPYDLRVRNNDHRGVSLCAECYGSIQSELPGAP